MTCMVKPVGSYNESSPLGVVEVPFIMRVSLYIYFSNFSHLVVIL